MSFARTMVGTALLACMAAMAGEPETIAAPAAFHFSGGEKIRLIVSPAVVGETYDQLVTDDGYIALPTGGDQLNIFGKTITEAQKLVAARIEKDSGVLKSTVSIALLGVPLRGVYVGGEGIRTSQSVALTGGNPLTLYAAILAAGGISPDGDATRVSLSRPMSSGVAKTEIFDVSRFGDSDSKSLGPILQAGDVIKVPRGETIILAGEVFRPGPLNRRELASSPDKTLRVSNAIYVTGGLKPGASRRNIKILRQSKNGNRVVLSADLDAVEKGDSNQNTGANINPRQPLPAGISDADPALENGDIVIVSPAGNIPVLGKVRNPNLYPISGQSIKLTRMIAMAGGFAEFAKVSSVIVVKANNPGSPIHVDMSQLQKGGFQDIDLEEGDIVYVPERLL